jgi:hypothetical protein
MWHRSQSDHILLASVDNVVTCIDARILLAAEPGGHTPVWSRVTARQFLGSALIGTR